MTAGVFEDTLRIKCARTTPPLALTRVRSRRLMNNPGLELGPIFFYKREADKRCQIPQLLPVVTKARGSMNSVHVGIVMSQNFFCIN